MKKHLAVLCGVYYPNPSPTGQCVDRFIELLKDEYTIDVISLSESDREEQIRRADGVRVFTLCGRRLATERRACGLAKKLLHLLGNVEIKTNWLGNLQWFPVKAVRLLSKLHLEKPYDAVFSVCSPMVAHVAAAVFKENHPTVRHVAYTVDPYATPMRPRPFGWSLKRLKQTENEYLLKADHLLLSEEVFATRPELQQLAKPLPYILPEAIPAELIPDKQTIDCVYAGRFYKDIRNPEPMLSCFSDMNDPRIRLHLYTVGCEELVAKYAGRDSRIIVHGLQPHEEILRVYAKADVLVNVGNTAPDFLPSKTFEYIATGKPILHFQNGGSASAPLSIYPLSCQIGNDPSVAEGFVRSVAGKTNTRDEICKIYSKHSLENVKQQILAALEIKG